MKIYPNSVVRTFFIIFFLSVFLHQGCKKLKYTPTGVSEKAIANPPDPSNIWVTDSTLETDTLKIWGRKNIHYHFKSNRPIAAVRVSLNGKELYLNQDTHQGSFYFDSKIYENGLYFLTFEILLKTESGSLASALNSEFFMAIKKIPLLILNYDPIPLKITSVQPEEGTLRIRWEKYPYLNFQNYIIYANGKKIQEITDREKTFCDFKDYLGGNKKLNFQVYLHAGDSWAYGPYFEYAHPYQLKLQSIEITNNKPEFKWNECPFYQNLVSYQIEYCLNEVFDFNKYAEIISASQTTYTGNPIYFGGFYYFRVLAVSRNQDYTLRSNIKSTYIGERTKRFVRIHYSPASDALYFNPADFYGIMVDGRLYRINPITLQADATFSQKECTVAMNDDGTEIFVTTPLSRFDKRKFFQLNPTDLSIQKTFYMDSLFLNDNEYPTMESIVHVAPHSLLFMVHGSPKKFIKYDYQNGTWIVNKLSANSYGPYIKARSSLGKYLLMQADQTYTIYDVSGDQFIAKGNINSPDYFCFGSEEETYITTNMPNITIHSCATGDVIKKIPIGHSIRYPTIDPKTGYLGGYMDIWKKYYYVVYNLTTGEERLRTRLAGGARYRLVNNTIFYPSGLALKLNLE